VTTYRCPYCGQTFPNDSHVPCPEKTGDLNGGDSFDPGIIGDGSRLGGRLVDAIGAALGVDTGTISEARFKAAVDAARATLRGER
jgi:hypothetical protein